MGRRPRHDIRRASNLAVALTLALGSCKAAEKARAKRRCDQDRLATLAKELDANQPDARIMIVSEGLLEACGDELYPTVRSLLSDIATPDQALPFPGWEQDPAYGQAIERICPKHARIGEVMAKAKDRGPAVAELCGFDRYEVLGADELETLDGHGLFVWATHDFLLESGTPPEVARTISRALFRVHDVVLGPVLIHPPPSLELIRLPVGAPLRGGPTIYVSHAELLFNEQQLATLERGTIVDGSVNAHVIGPLFQTLDEERAKGEAVRAAVEGPDAPPADIATLVVGAGVRFGTVVDTMYTSGRVGYDHFDLVVEPIYPIKRALRIDAPRFVGFGERPVNESLKVFILDDAYRVSWDSAGEPRRLPKLDTKGNGPEAWDRGELAALARGLKADHPNMHQLVISAENHITMDVVLATYAAAIGPDCEQHEDGAGCVLPDLVLEAGAG